MPSPSLTGAVAGVSVVAALLAWSLVRAPTSGHQVDSAVARSVIRSPRLSLLPRLSAHEAARMAYPPNAMPGARDVDTPYGSMRVYEWGPEAGRKVLFVHGDATPSPLFSKIAQRLVDAGCRVMLFDLWGRGYSDTPLDCRHDVRLFSLQILFAATSSPISWTDPADPFSIVAFSLGSPISLAFTAAFPALVRSLVLLGPAGLLRVFPDEYNDFFIFHPELAPSVAFLRERVRRALGVAKSGPSPPALSASSPNGGVRRVAKAPSRVEAEFDMGRIVQWQFDVHQGHVHSFQETIRYRSAQHQHPLFRSVCDMIAGRSRPDVPLHKTKLLVVFGRDDDVVVPSETTEDILAMLPPEHLVVEHVPGGHGFPYPNSETIAKTILGFWS